MSRLRAMAAVRCAVVGALLVAGCRKQAVAPFYQKVAVGRRDIVVTANADGTVLPLDSTEVKSKASGEVIALLVETGDLVRKGQLLVQIDPRNLRNAVTQAQADLDAAQASLVTATAQFRRAQDLFASRSITEQEMENVQLQMANANDAVVRARVALENAQIAFEDADVRAPSDGVVLQKNVEVGTVISSATSVIGGTVLLKIASLDTMQVRALVDETDIGKIQPGQSVSITVDAYPARAFSGRVQKIEPQATIQQNVTLFPILVKIPNPGHLLRSGMSGEIEIHIGERPNAIAVPNAALRTAHDVASAAAVLGLTLADVERQIGTAESVATSPLETPGRTLPGEIGVFGGTYIVFVLRGGAPWARRVQTGLSDLNYAEVISGLAAGDTVLLLPSASLVASQENLQQRAQRIGGAALPGVQRQSTVPAGAARGRVPVPGRP